MDNHCREGAGKNIKYERKLRHMAAMIQHNLMCMILYMKHKNVVQVEDE
jgi:hypothetical protein